MTVRRLLCILAALCASSVASAASIQVRDGWVVINTSKPYTRLVDQLETAVKDEKMGLVTSASASEGAKAAGVTIAGNRVVGVFRNDFARQMLKASVAAGIEASIRVYVTENDDATATLSYKKPSFVFAPYFPEGGDQLKALAAELDGIFERIAAAATN
jgi:uncharacterized protein (DUF302 family)